MEENENENENVDVKFLRNGSVVYDIISLKQIKISILSTELGAVDIHWLEDVKEYLQTIEKFNFLVEPNIIIKSILYILSQYITIEKSVVRFDFCKNDLFYTINKGKNYEIGFTIKGISYFMSKNGKWSIFSKNFADSFDGKEHLSSSKENIPYYSYQILDELRNIF